MLLDQLRDNNNNNNYSKNNNSNINSNNNSNNDKKVLSKLIKIDKTIKKSNEQ